MATSSRSKLVRCPFYRFDDGKISIGCEGVTGGSRLTLHFQKRQEWMQQMQIFCECRYECCEVYRIIMEARYPDDD